MWRVCDFPALLVWERQRDRSACALSGRRFAYTGEHTERAILGFVDKLLSPSYATLRTLEDLQGLVQSVHDKLRKRPFVIVRRSCVAIARACCVRIAIVLLLFVCASLEFGRESLHLLRRSLRARSLTTSWT